MNKNKLKFIVKILLISILFVEGGYLIVFNKEIFVSHNIDTQNISQLPFSNTLSITPSKTVEKTTIPISTSVPEEDTCFNLLVIVNKTYSLPLEYIPPDLVNLRDNGISTTSKDSRLRSVATADLKNMMFAMDSAGISTIVLSAYRSFQDQDKLFEQYTSIYGLDKANTFSAQPGHSQHQLGLAVDFTTTEISNALDNSFANTKAGKWLHDNSYKYGFILSYPDGYDKSTGYEYEPWHYRYIGINYADDLVKKNIILESYLSKYGVLPNCK